MWVSHYFWTIFLFMQRTQIQGSEMKRIQLDPQHCLKILFLIFIFVKKKMVPEHLAKCVADWTRRTGCIKASRTTRDISAPE